MAEANVFVSDSKLENDCNSPESPGPSTSKQNPKSSRTHGEAAKYRSKFNTNWKKQYPFIDKVRAGKHSFYCTICKGNVKCGHMGLSDVQRHVTMSMHQRYAKDARWQTTLSFQSLSSPVTEEVNLFLMINLSFLTI